MEIKKGDKVRIIKCGCNRGHDGEEGILHSVFRGYRWYWLVREEHLLRPLCSAISIELVKPKRKENMARTTGSKNRSFETKVLAELKEVKSSNKELKELVKQLTRSLGEMTFRASFKY